MDLIEGDNIFLFIMDNNQGCTQDLTSTMWINLVDT